MKEYMIYGKPNCPYCDKIFKFMKERNEKFVYIMVNNMEDSLNEIKGIYSWKTVPIVVELLEYEGEKIAKLIGGCDDTIKYFKEEV